MATKENRPMTEEINLTNFVGRISEKEVKAKETKKIILISQISNFGAIIGDTLQVKIIFVSA